MEALARFGGNAGRDAGEANRRMARQARHRSVAIGSHGSQACEAAIRDISFHGCRVESPHGRLRTGTFVALCPDPECSVMGIVRWVRAETAGIEFLHPLRPGDRAWQALLGDDD